MQSSRSKTISGLSATTEEDAARDVARRQEGRREGRRSAASMAVPATAIALERKKRKKRSDLRILELAERK